jgi:hypothetical protein
LRNVYAGPLAFPGFLSLMFISIGLNGIFSYKSFKWNANEMQIVKELNEAIYNCFMQESIQPF